MLNSPLHQIILGFKSPLHSLKFFRRYKAMLILGIAPHFVNIIIYFWILRNIVIGKWLIPLFNSLAVKWDGTFLAPMFQPFLIEIVVWVLGIIFYSIFGTSIVNAVASPIYDIIAQNCFEKTALKKIPKQTLMDFIDSILSEITKAIIVFCIFIITFFVHIFAPIVILAGAWYLGWNHIDRTLLLLNLPLKKRLSFGINNFWTCVGLGIWSYIPIIGTLFSFSMAAAGAIIVANISTSTPPTE